MQKRFEIITQHIDWMQKLQDEPSPVLNYRQVTAFIEDVYSIVSTYKEYELKNYVEVLDKLQIDTDERALQRLNVSSLNVQGTLALIVYIIRADRFLEGILDEYLTNGHMLSWLKHLRDLDV